MSTQPLTNIVKSFAKRTIHTNLIRSNASKEESLGFRNLQEDSMDENLFLVDETDKVTGHASKRECHQVGKDGSIPLHRAFSVYLFNNQGDLLLQKRSANKITYPNLYTNSCCSHPVADIPGEEEETDALGVKKAAQRRLHFELGIPKDEIPIEKFKYITRLYYMDRGDGKWGEHELYYFLILQGDVSINPNPDEISKITFVPRNELDKVVPTLGGLTPWFRMILQHRLRLWWDNLDNLDQYQDHKNILQLESL